MAYRKPPDDVLRGLLTTAHVIAMVGASARPERPSHGVMRFLLQRGYRVIPVTPNAAEVLGQRAYPSLAAIEEPIDIVDFVPVDQINPAFFYRP